MFSCCRCVNPQSPKQKDKSSSGKGDKTSGSDDSHEEDDQRNRQEQEQKEANTTSACQNSAVDNFSQDDEEIKIEIIENSDNQQSYSGSVATTAVLNGSSPEPKTPEADVSPGELRQSSPVVDRQPRGNHNEEESNESKLTGAVRPGEEDNLADPPANAAGSASSSPASKTLSNTERGQTDHSGQSSAVVTEIEVKLPNESTTDADSTGDATNTPQEIPTTVGEMVEVREQEVGTDDKTVDEPVTVSDPESPNRISTQPSSPTEKSGLSPRNEGEDFVSSADNMQNGQSRSVVEHEKEPPATEQPYDGTVPLPRNLLAEEQRDTIVMELVKEQLPSEECTVGHEQGNERDVELEAVATIGQASETELKPENLPAPSVEVPEGSDVADAFGREKQNVSLASKFERLTSEPSNSEETIEETIDVDKFLPRKSGSKSDDDNPLSTTSGSSADGGAGGPPVISDDEPAAGAQDIDNEVPPAAVIATAAMDIGGGDPPEEKGEEAVGPHSATPSPPDATADSPEVECEEDGPPSSAAVDSNNDQVSKSSSEGRDSNNEDTSTLSESVANTVTNGGSPSGAEADNSSSRKESVNSDDTTIRTQVSFRESCLSRRSSSKSSIKKKVAYCDSTEVIPPPEYPPPEDDDSVFSDSVPPKLPRGDMCTPYATKRGSLPGMIALPDWFAEDRLMMLVFSSTLVH